MKIKAAQLTVKDATFKDVLDHIHATYPELVVDELYAEDGAIVVSLSTPKNPMGF